MSTQQTKTNVLVVLATGKMGRGVTEAFVANGNYNVFGTSRDANNASLKAKGVTPVAFKFGDKQSMIDAIQASKATVVFLNTDFERAAGQSGAVEAEQGIIMVDACKEQGVEYVIHCSILVAEAPLGDFASKLAIEKRLAASGLAHTVLRPGCFFDNFDDAANENPLVRGQIAFLFNGDAKVAHVATTDMGVAAINVLADRAKWSGKVIDAVACNVTGDEIAEVLSEVSGVESTYSASMGLEELKAVAPAAYLLTVFFNESKYVADPATFRALVGPNVIGPKEHFTALGQWANGDKFGATAAN